jgi:hypothetical protein
LTLTLLAGASSTRVESVDDDTYGRTITWTARPGLLKNLARRCRAPAARPLAVSEGLIHVVDRAGRLGINTDHAAMAAMLRADAVPGPLAT